MAITPRAGAVLLLLLALLALPAGAAEKPKKDFALIYTTVFGPDQMGRYGVQVKVRRADQKKPKWEGFTDHAGEVAFRVPTGPADYIVWAEIKKTKGQAPPETKVHVDNDERVNATLHLTE